MVALKPRWRVVAGMNYLDARRQSAGGRYNIRLGLFSVQYSLRDASFRDSLFAEYLLDESLRADGTGYPNAFVVGIGGGIVTDVAGFAASIYHRGLPLIQIPTTLLGQIDAAIGGKTGVNLPEGKNLVGAYWQPLAVLCDLETLHTLPARHYQAGLGEMAKYHFLDDGSLNTLRQETLIDGRLGIDALAARVEASVRLKAHAVSADEREGGQRALLNYGHTLGHALETHGDHDLLHGEAVAIGIAYAAEVAYSLGRIDRNRLKEHRRVLASYDLPMRPPGSPRFDDLLPIMQRDKKALDGITFILDGPNGCEVVENVEPSDLATTYERFVE